MKLDRILELCNAEGSNLSRLERDCGLSNAVIRRWKNSSPSAENLQKVADHFGVSVDYLLGRQGYDISEDEREYAKKYADLPEEKQRLVKIYMSVIAAQ